MVTIIILALALFVLLGFAGTGKNRYDNSHEKRTPRGSMRMPKGHDIKRRSPISDLPSQQRKPDVKKHSSNASHNINKNSSSKNNNVSSPKSSFGGGKSRGGGAGRQ